MRRQTHGLIIVALTLSLSIFALPTLAQDVMNIVNGKVGIGTNNPVNTLDLQGQGVTFNVKDTSASEAPRILFRLTNNGRIDFNMYNTANESNWQFSNTLVGFQINDTLSPGTELRVNTAGNLYLEGQVFASSSIEKKESIQALDGSDVLQRLASVPVTQWTYRDSSVRHIGPMAEDFYAAFGIGQNDKTLSPSDTSGVALIAIQELMRQVEQRDSEITRLKENLEVQRERHSALEQRLQNLELQVTTTQVPLR